MKVRRFGTALAAGALLVAFVGCSSSGPSGEPSARSTSEAIQGGSVDSTHTFAVGLCINGGGPSGTYPCTAFCSGALIAPNLVVTARHCVQQAPEQIDCASSQFGSPYSTWAVTTDTDMSSATHWYPVRSGGVLTPSATAVCGNDIALLILKSNVPASVATPITPVGQYPMTDNRYGYVENAIGYGATDASTNPPGVGTRRIKSGIDIACIPGDKLRDCGNLSGTQITANEFVTGDGTCGGDSGSSAYNAADFDTTVESFGVLSRGGQNGTMCQGGIYTRMDAYRSLILQAVNQASQLGGYALPAWTQPAPAAGKDGGAPVTKKDGGASGGQGALGDTCSKDGDCQSNTCLSVDGTNFTCTQSCDTSASPSTCPDGFACKSTDSGGYCFAASGDSGGGGSKSKSGCSMSAADPTRPVPWKGLSLVGVMLVALRRRRRARG